MCVTQEYQMIKNILMIVGKEIKAIFTVDFKDQNVPWQNKSSVLFSRALGNFESVHELGMHFQIPKSSLKAICVIKI